MMVPSSEHKRPKDKAEKASGTRSPKVWHNSCSRGAFHVPQSTRKLHPAILIRVEVPCFTTCPSECDPRLAAA